MSHLFFLGYNCLVLDRAAFHSEETARGRARLVGGEALDNVAGLRLRLS